MDFPRLMALLEHRSLHLSRLEDFADKYEGFVNCLTEEDHYDITNDGNMVRVAADQLNSRNRENSAKFKNFVAPWSKALFKATGVNCWRIDCNESHAMWRVFGETDLSVAVQSTVGRLVRSIEPNDHTMFIGAVQYIDYAKTKIPITNMLNPIFHKSEYFSDERELRLACNKSMNKGATDFSPNSYIPMPAGGVDLPVSVEALVEAVVVSPYAPDWFLGLVDAVIRRYGYTVQVQPSIIALRK
jgi:hypothetical protein